MYKLDQLVAYAKAQGFIYQGSEVYGGLANTWDYGPLGALLKKNIKEAWTLAFVRKGHNTVLLDSSILMNTKVWQASGHVGGFSDPLIENKDSNQRYRADKLIIEHNPQINPDGWSFTQMYDYIVEHKIKCPVSKSANWLPIRAFNMMFQTFQGVVLETANQIYLRPETAQGIFINFKNILRTTRKKIPFGVGQIGKAFRNEITPGNFIFRTREFEQMELEFFCKPGTEIQWFEHYKKQCQQFLLNLGISAKNLQLDDHKPESLSHYSNATTDILYNFPWGFDELWGIASRTDFDLNAHQTASAQDFTYLDDTDNSRFIPYVIEPSVGVERLLMMFLLEGLQDEVVAENDERQLLKIHPFLAPYKAVILPLVKKEHAPKAQEIYEMLSQYFDVAYDESASIGKRYRRADAIGTYFAVTVDHQTLIDNTVTIRNRDTMQQQRVNIDDLKTIIEKTLIF